MRFNVNRGNNEVLKEQCQVLKEYTQYVECVRKHAGIVSVEEAVVLAVDECIGKGILSEFLRKNRAKVIPMSIFEYNEEATLKAIREDEFEAGMQKGIEQGILCSGGAVIEACVGPGKSRQDTATMLKDKFQLSEARVCEYMEKYWK